MPNSIPNFQISNFLSRHTHPVPVRSLPTDSPQDRQCPICRTFYAEPPSSYVHPDCPRDIHEYACQIQHLAGCRHIFGRHCLERHIRGGEPWSHTCPTCRGEWFPAPHTRRTEVLDNIESVLDGLASLGVEDEQVRREVEDVERAVRRIRDLMYVNRWI